MRSTGVLIAILLNAVSTELVGQCSDAFSQQHENQLAPAHETPRQLDLSATFSALVDWMHDDLIIKQNTPGFVVGLSGTDSTVVFLAAASAFQKAGRPSRVAGIHFGNIQDSWYAQEIMPWLKKHHPEATLIVDDTINANRDGARWGALLDWSVLQEGDSGMMRAPTDRYWVLGTRNATEQSLGTYSNLSMAASIQPIVHLWKSEVLALSRFLQIPTAAIERSCEVDCPCGRHQIAALNIPEIDAMLMTREGSLHCGYTVHNLPRQLRLQLERYIDEQIDIASFKNEIPYYPSKDLARLDQSKPRNLDLYSDAKIAAANDSHGTETISRAVPVLIADQEANLAADLINSSSRNIDSWLGEALSLFNTPHLRSSQQRQMIHKLFGEQELNTGEVKRLSRISGKIGYYGFSFPQWRFLTQRNQLGVSLAEEFGLARLTRSTDFRDETRPFSDPNRDEWGIGFVRNSDTQTIEYRRAYILVSERSEFGSATLIIRNNSYFFGRDRLSLPVYVSWQPMAQWDLENLGKPDLDEGGKFLTLTDIFKRNIEITTAEKLKRLHRLLSILDDFNKEMSKWLSGSGRDIFLRFLLEKVSSQRGSEPQFYLNSVSNSVPSWQLNGASLPVSSNLIASKSLTEFLDRVSKSDTEQLVVLSSADGDFPVSSSKE